MEDRIIHLGLLDDETIPLDAAALEIASIDHPEVDLKPYTDVLTDLTRRLAELDEADTNEDKAGLLARVIGGEYGFVGDRATYDHPDNADMIRVIDRRRGLPVSLTILYVAAARRMGWTADALNTPGHVLARIGGDIAPVLIDPFNDGAIVDQTRLAGLLAQSPGGQAREHLRGMANRDVLVRLLMNQATRAERAGDRARTLALYARMTDIAPATGHAWWERARLELLDGNVPATRRSLSAMLEMTRDPDRRRPIAAALEALAGSEP